MQKTILALAALAALGYPAMFTASAAADFGKPVAPARVADVTRHIVGGPWTTASPVSPARNCPTVYMLTSRTCPYCRAFFKEQFLPLSRKGYDFRLHYAAVDSENQDSMAEIAYRRDIRLTLSQQAGREVSGPPRLKGPVPRLNAYIAMLDALETTVNLSRSAGYSGFLPSFIWQDRTGRWRIASGYSADIMPEFLASLPEPSPACAMPS